jgi:elongation factor Ts
MSPPPKPLAAATPQSCLQAAGWAIDGAYDLLRKKGLAAAAKKASRHAADGLAGLALAPDAAVAAIV